MDWAHIGVTAAGFIATIATIKADIRWIKKWMDKHENFDTHRFERLESKIDSL